MGNFGVAGDDFVDQRRDFRGGVADRYGTGEQAFCFGETPLLVGEHGAERLPGLNAGVQFGVHFKACSGRDRLPCFFASCAKPLDCPADLLAVHVSDKTTVAGAKFAPELR